MRQSSWKAEQMEAGLETSSPGSLAPTYLGRQRCTDEKTESKLKTGDMKLIGSWSPHPFSCETGLKLEIAVPTMSFTLMLAMGGS